MATSSEYRLDTHFGSGSVRHVVDADRLVMTYEKTARREEIPHATITELNLRQDMPGVFNLRVVRRGGRTITIPSRHFVGVGRFENRGAEYVVFVQAVHAAVRAANPGARFVAGSSLLFALGWVMLALAILMVGLVLFGVLIQGHTMPPLRVLWVLPVTFLVGGGFVAQGRARAYDADALPVKLLPR